MSPTPEQILQFLEEHDEELSYEPEPPTMKTLIEIANNTRSDAQPSIEDEILQEMIDQGFNGYNWLKATTRLHSDWESAYFAAQNNHSARMTHLFNQVGLLRARAKSLSNSTTNASTGTSHTPYNTNDFEFANTDISIIPQSPGQCLPIYKSPISHQRKLIFTFASDRAIERLQTNDFKRLIQHSLNGPQDHGVRRYVDRVNGRLTIFNATNIGPDFPEATVYYISHTSESPVYADFAYRSFLAHNPVF